MSKGPNSLKVAVGRRWLAGIARVFLGCLAVYFVVRSQRGWSDAAFWSAGLKLAHAGNWAGIYDPAVNPYAMRGYSPVSLYIVLYPLGYLTDRAIRVALTLATVGLWLATIVAFNRVLPAIRPRLQGGADAVWGLGVCQRFLGSDLMANQINALSFAPACFGLALMLHSAWWSTMLGGTLIAAATGMKMYPIALVALLWVKRAWRQAATATALTVGMLWFVPWAVLGSEEFARVRAQQSASSNDRLWLHESSSELWGLPNFLYYRCFVAPPGGIGIDLSPTGFQVLVACVTAAIGLALLPALARNRWSESTAESLFEDIAIVGAALCLIDPVGRTAHFVMAAPAHCLLLSRWINDWDRDRKLPSISRMSAYAFVLFANNFLVIALPGVRHYWYMHYGLFSLGMALLLTLVVHDTASRRRIAVRTPTATVQVTHCQRAA